MLVVPGLGADAEAAGAACIAPGGTGRNIEPVIGLSAGPWNG